MEKDRKRNNCKSSSLKCFLLCSLSCLLIQDVSFAKSLDCEVRASCYQSRECQYTNQMTVDPASNVTLNCSIMNGGVTQGMTWNQVKQRVNASDGLVLQQMNLTALKNSCRCINFTRKVLTVFKTGSPVMDIYENEPIKLEFSVKGWPRPRVVWYKPDGKQIINGSEGFYLSEELIGEDTLKSVVRHPKIQEKLEGDYKCIGENSIPGWSSEVSGIIEVILACSWPQHPTVNSPVYATIFSNITLKCLVEVYPNYCWPPFSLQWRFNNYSAPLKTGEKYEIQERKTDTKCKKDFILTIVNVTDADEGKYSCHYLCDFEDQFAAIELYVFHERPTVSALTTLHPATGNITISSQSATAHSHGWCIVLIIILSSGVVFD